MRRDMSMAEEHSVASFDDYDTAAAVAAEHGAEVESSQAITRRCLIHIMGGDYDPSDIHGDPPYYIRVDAGKQQ